MACRTAGRRFRLVVCLSLAAAVAPVAAQPEAPPLTREEMRAFLATAHIESARPVGAGITGVSRLTLSDGRVTWDAAFQSIDERFTAQDVARGRRRAGEVRFVDSYKYNIAAYEIAELVGLGSMVPVTVERRWGGAPPGRRTGAFSWWVPAQMDEAERRRRNVPPPDPVEWDRQIHRMRVFTELVLDTDRNLGNILITPDWQVVMIDFTRAFRLEGRLRWPEGLLRCDRQLLARLTALTDADVRRAVGSQLTRFEREALMRRRDLIVRHFEQLIAERGEARVLY